MTAQFEAGPVAQPLIPAKACEKSTSREHEKKTDGGDEKSDGHVKRGGLEVGQGEGVKPDVESYA